MNENYPVIAKTYQFMLWYIKKLSTLPKNHRFTLGQKIETILIDLMMLLSDAVYSKQRLELLKEANKNIEKIRLLTRLLKDLSILSKDNFYFITNELNEIGSQLGGWIKNAK